MSVITRAGQKIRVLVVDDEQLVTRALERLLAGEFAVTTAATAALALDLLAEEPHRFDVILCDLEMPNTTGIEFVALATARHPHLLGKIVIMTAGPLTAEHERYLYKLRDGVIAKPFDLEFIRSVISSRCCDE